MPQGQDAGMDLSCLVGVIQLYVHEQGDTGVICRRLPTVCLKGDPELCPECAEGLWLVFMTLKERQNLLETH